jgi:hypothetical protein
VVDQLTRVSPLLFNVAELLIFRQSFGAYIALETQLLAR